MLHLVGGDEWQGSFRNTQGAKRKGGKVPPQVQISDYDPQWPHRFAEESAAIRSAIGKWAVRVEHIGSTAVPGLPAKPIIDIMVGLHRLSDADHCLAPLAAIDYEYIPEYESAIPERRYFRKGPQTRHFHLHMVEIESEFWNRHLAFRDYLRSHLQTAKAYEVLKRRLAASYQADREGYTEAKTDFIQSVLAQARAEESNQ
jgi:GrpB-like predicted nucleotidyltransferase (UPF0157 family)